MRQDELAKVKKAMILRNKAQICLNSKPLNLLIAFRTINEFYLIFFFTSLGKNENNQNNKYLSINLVLIPNNFFLLSIGQIPGWYLLATSRNKTVLSQRSPGC